MAQSAQSLSDVLAWRADRSGHVVASVDDICQGGGRFSSKRLTYEELHAAAELLAGVLSSCLEACGPDAVVATHMRRGHEWYAVFFAASRLQAPLVALSADLPDKSVEGRRNREILSEHRPELLVTDDGAANLAEEAARLAGRVISISELWALGDVAAARGRVPGGAEAPELREGLGGRALSPEATLCFCYTGGTTEASRCVRVTHGMALHEVTSYQHVANLTPADSVLQQHSLYWGASAYGEVDIALAFGCALVFCEAWGVDGVSDAIVANKATCAGLVPSILSSLDPREVPSLRLVFTWGEALQAKVAREWASRLRLVDLLISTECWLSLYADWTEHVARWVATAPGAANGFGSPEFRAVSGAQIRVRALEDADPGGGAGELLIAGPMVTPGYTDSARNAAVLLEEGGVRWYCTRDCVEPQGAGYAFAGRADDLVKVGGVWVDVREVEQELVAVPGVREARILRRDAFVAIEALSEGTVPSLRRVLPPDFALFIVPELPRRAGTEKVDRRHLTELTEHKLAPICQQREEQRCRQELDELWKWRLPLALLGLACLLHAGGEAWRIGRSLPTGSEAGGPLLPSPAVGLWLASLLVLLTVWECFWRLCCLAFVQLVFFLGCWPEACRKVSEACENVPFGLQGGMILVVAALPGPLSGAVLALPGAIKAAQRGRLLSWPLVCLVGFPIWARKEGAWWADKGVLGSLKWYWQGTKRRVAACAESACAAPRALARRSARSFSEVYWCAALALGFAMKCKQCNRRFQTSEGHVDPAVDAAWYCQKCWRNYWRHRQCSAPDCKEWFIRGGTDAETGTWMCERCLRKITFNRTAAKEDALKDLKEPLLADSSGQHSEKPPERPAEGAADNRGPAETKFVHYGYANQAQGGEVNGNDGVDKWGRRKPEFRKLVLDLNIPQLLRQPDDSVARAGQDRHHCAAEAGACPQPAETKCCEWLLVERATGWTFSSTGDSLASLDSLRTAKIASALLREAGVRLSRQALRRCATLGELLGEIEQVRGRPCEGGDGLGAIVEERKIWGLMWNSKCQWMLRRDRPLPEAVLRAALLKLMDRHPALRARLADPMNLFTVTQQAFSAFEMWRMHRRWRPAGGPLAALVDAAARAVQWSFRHAWPRIGAAPSGSVPLHVMPHSADIQGARRALWMPQFEPPLQICLAPFDDGALMWISVTHMTSDGYCLMPLLADLAHFVAQEEAAAGGGPVVSPPPPLPSALAVVESRIMKAIDGNGASNDAPTLDPISPLSRAWNKKSATVLTIIPPEVVSGIGRTARLLAVSDDVVMLAAVGATLARFEGTPVVPVTVVAPQRDGPGESDMVGLFADLRIISVRTGGLSFAGLVMWLHKVVQDRLWRSPPTETQYEMPFVNFEWTDFESRHGFTQFVQCREGAEHLQNPLKVAVDQPDRLSWRTRMAFDTKLYGQEKREQFLTLFELSIRNLLMSPLEMIWPEP